MYVRLNNNEHSNWDFFFSQRFKRNIKLRSSANIKDFHFSIDSKIHFQRIPVVDSLATLYALYNIVHAKPFRRYNML